MGTVYCGPYADAIGYDTHEGYVGQLLDDGREVPAWTAEEFAGYVARCACGWRGTLTHPPTDIGEDCAREEWTRDHLNPLVDSEAARHSAPATVLIAHLRDLQRRARARVERGGDMDGFGSACARRLTTSASCLTT